MKYIVKIVDSEGEVVYSGEFSDKKDTIDFMNSRIEEILGAGWSLAVCSFVN